MPRTMLVAGALAALAVAAPTEARPDLPGTPLAERLQAAPSTEIAAPFDLQIGASYAESRPALRALADGMERVTGQRAHVRAVDVQTFERIGPAQYMLGFKMVAGRTRIEITFCGASAETALEDYRLSAVAVYDALPMVAAREDWGGILSVLGDFPGHVRLGFQRYPGGLGIVLNEVTLEIPAAPGATLDETPVAYALSARAAASGPLDGGYLSMTEIIHKPSGDCDLLIGDAEYESVEPVTLD